MHAHNTSIMEDTQTQFKWRGHRSRNDEREGRAFVVLSSSWSMLRKKDLFFGKLTGDKDEHCRA